jgi:transposase
MVYFLGCDVSKRKLDLSLVNEQGIEQWHGQVANETRDIATMLVTITGEYAQAEVRCVVESTGCYHREFADTAYELGLACLIYNPIITKQQIRATIRGKKTDRTDALMIARIGLRGEGRVYAPEPYPTTRYYARGQQRLGQFALALHAYQTHVESLLGEEMSPEAKSSLAELEQAFHSARQLFGQEMTASAPEALSKRLQSIPGVGPFIAASLIGEIQDMSRFRSSKQLIAYVGLDPRIKQSGHTLNSTGRLTKRGSSYLRRNMFIAASVARQHDPLFKELYDKKRAEGKSYTVAVCVVARKLLTVMRAVWIGEVNYNREQMTSTL